MDVLTNILFITIVLTHILKGYFDMLVLTRRAGESIMIDNEIELKVLKIRGSQVHLGIDAPKKSTVHRKEVWLRIHGEAQAAKA